MVDGVSVNSLQWGGAATVTPSLESVQEITVLSSDYDATDGRSSGAHVKVVTKSAVRQPLRQMGVVAAETLLARIGTPRNNSHPKRVTLKPELVVRGTTAPAHTAD